MPCSGAATAVQLFERFRKVSGPRRGASGSWQVAQAPSYELCRLAMIAFKQSGYAPPRRQWIASGLAH